MGLKSLTDQGVTRIRTRRQRLRLALKIGWVLLGVVAAVYVGAAVASVATGHGWHLPRVSFRSPLAGHGPLINLSGKKGGTRHPQVPVTLWLPVPWLAALAGAVPLWAGWMLLQRQLVSRRRYVGPDRHRGLAAVKDIREVFSARAVRAAGVFTLPGTTRWQRMVLPMTYFGYYVGSPYVPRVKGMPLWFNFETRLRIIARSGWGKSWRLLIPIIRRLPGAAVITSVEGEIFDATVKARASRLPPVRFEWMRRLRKTWRTPRMYPIIVADLAAADSKFASGFPELHWNPIVGSEDFKVASGRARALVSGGDSDSSSSDSGTDKFFRDSATEVLAAWLQACALDPTKDIEDLREWLTKTDLDAPEAILATAGTAEAKTAVMNMITHLDPQAGRTTSGVKRFLNFAISSLTSGQGRKLCGPRSGPQFDMGALIQAGGTVYLLAEPQEMELARPLLTLLATEMFLAAENTARKLRGRRHRQTFMGIFDELFAGVRMPLLPYVASVQRKYGISFAYAIQSSSDEDELFGKSGAQRLRNQCITIVGGYDSDSAQETSRRAGRTSVVTRSVGVDGGGSEHIQIEDVLPESDQQKLKNGQSIIIGLGISPFLAFTRRVDHKRRVRKTIGRERRQVEDFVIRHRRDALSSSRASGLYSHPTPAADAAAPSLVKENITV